MSLTVEIWTRIGGDIMFLWSLFLSLCLPARASLRGLNCTDQFHDDRKKRDESSAWRIGVGPDRYYMIRTGRFEYWNKANSLCGNYYKDFQLAVPHSPDDVHFIRELMLRPSYPGGCIYVGKLIMTT